MAAAERQPPASGDAKAPLAADTTAAKATGDLAELERGNERTKLAAKEAGEAASPGAKCVEGVTGEAAAAAAEAGSCAVAGTVQTRDSGSVQIEDPCLDGAR